MSFIDRLILWVFISVASVSMSLMGSIIKHGFVNGKIIVTQLDLICIPIILLIFFCMCMFL